MELGGRTRHSTEEGGLHGEDDDEGLDLGPRLARQCLRLRCQWSMGWRKIWVFDDQPVVAKEELRCRWALPVRLERQRWKAMFFADSSPRSWGWSSLNRTVVATIVEGLGVAVLSSVEALGVRRWQMKWKRHR